MIFRELSDERAVRQTVKQMREREKQGMRRKAEYIFILIVQIICPSRNTSKHRGAIHPLETPKILTENLLHLIIVLPEACLLLSFQVISWNNYLSI